MAPSLHNFDIKKLDRNGVVPIMDINSTLPERITGSQRRQEVVQLLAHGIARLHLPKCYIPINPETDSQLELTIPPRKNLHAVSNQFY